MRPLLVVSSGPPAAPLLPLCFIRLVLVSLVLLVAQAPGLLAALVFWDFSFFLDRFQESLDVFNVCSLCLSPLGVTSDRLSIGRRPLRSLFVQWSVFNPCERTKE